MGQFWLAISLYVAALNVVDLLSTPPKMEKEMALKVIDDVATLNLKLLCVSNNFQSVGVEVQTSRYDSTRQKVDMAALLLQELGANHHNRGLADALSKSLILSDGHVLRARVLTLNLTSNQVVVPAVWKRGSSDLSGPEIVADGPRNGAKLDPNLPWYQEPGVTGLLRSPKFMESPQNASYRGWWTFPYYSCSASRWVLSYNIAVPPAGRHPLKGYLSVDVDISDLDVNQCDLRDSETDIAAFLGTHKCHNDTTRCVRNRGARGWQRGGYHCDCRPGFYSLGRNPQGAFNGTLMEAAWAEREGNVSKQFDVVFRCYPCAPGCETCQDYSPCLACYNWPFRVCPK